MVAILKNVPEEGPGSIETFLLKHAIPYRIFETQEGSFPFSLDGYRALVILGGPMGVYQLREYPYLKRTLALIEEGIGSNIPLLGICLGSQLIAYALGAKVYKGFGEEVGWKDIQLTEMGLVDPFMQLLATNPATGALDQAFKVFHWHGDTFDLPRGSIHLASSALYNHQAFRYGTHVYAFQFHIEVTEDMIHRWFLNHPLQGQMAQELTTLYPEYSTRALRFYQSFFGTSLEDSRR